MINRRTVFKILLFSALLTALLFLCAFILERKESIRRYADMKEASGKADVLILGSSHVINGLNPVMMYEDMGIAAYNLGGHGSIIPVSYYELLLALRDFHPSLVVLDGYMMERDYHFLDVMTDEYTDENRKDAVSQLHLCLDAFPPSRTKLHAVRDLVLDNGTRLRLLFPFMLYHNRWSSLSADDLVPAGMSAQDNRLLGAQIRYGLDWRIAEHSMDTGEQNETISEGERYLQMILAACRERDIRLALTYLACNSTEADRRAAERLGVLAASEGLPYLNMLSDDPTDMRTDYSDEGHLNLLGMVRATRAVEEFIVQNTPVPDRRGDDGYSLWQKRAEQYHLSLDERLLEAGSLTEALLILGADPGHADALLYMPGTGMASGDPAVCRLLDSYVPDNGVRKAHCDGEPSFVVIGSNNNTCDFCGYSVNDPTDVGLGSGKTLELIQVENFTGAYLDGDESENLLDMEDGRLSDAQLVLLDPDNGEVRKRLLFNYPTGAAPDEEG